jgi:phosphate transport system permease protein
LQDLNPLTVTKPAKPQAARRSLAEKLFDRGFIALTFVFAISVGFIILGIALTIAYGALPAITTYGLKFLATSAWNPVAGREDYGALPMIVGTVVSATIAVCIAVPLGVGMAIFLSEDFIPSFIRMALVFLVELLAAIPSVVYGLWGIFVLIPLIKPVGVWLNTYLGWFPLFSTPPAGLGMLPTGIVLAIMILPIITAISRDSLLALPSELRQAAYALGATRWDAIFQILIPAAASGMVGGIMLALGRALGETMAVTMLIGNSNRLSPSLLAPANTIASLLANQFAEAKAMQVSALMYAALILLVMTLLINLVAEHIVNRVRANYH